MSLIYGELIKICELVIVYKIDDRNGDANAEMKATNVRRRHFGWLNEVKRVKQQSRSRILVPCDSLVTIETDDRNGDANSETKATNFRRTHSGG